MADPFNTTAFDYEAALSAARGALEMMQALHTAEALPLRQKIEALMTAWEPVLATRGEDYLRVPVRGVYDAPHREGLGDRTFWLTPGLWVWNREQGRYDQVM